MGKGQQLRRRRQLFALFAIGLSSASPSPICSTRTILLGGEIFRRDYNSFNFVGGERNTTYSQTSTGGGAPRSASRSRNSCSFGTRYSLVNDKITLDEGTFYTDPRRRPDRSGCRVRSAQLAGRYLCDELGDADDARRSAIRSSTTTPTAFARRAASAGPEPGFRRAWRRREISPHPRRRDQIFAASEALRLLGPRRRRLHPRRCRSRRATAGTPIRLTDRFFGPQMRGFDIRGIGPRVQRVPYDTSTAS